MAMRRNGGWGILGLVRVYRWAWVQNFHINNNIYMIVRLGFLVAASIAACAVRELNLKAAKSSASSTKPSGACILSIIYIDFWWYSKLVILGKEILHLSTFFIYIFFSAFFQPYGLVILYEIVYALCVFFLNFFWSSFYYANLWLGWIGTQKIVSKVKMRDSKRRR